MKCKVLCDCKVQNSHFGYFCQYTSSTDSTTRCVYCNKMIKQVQLEFHRSMWKAYDKVQSSV